MIFVNFEHGLDAEYGFSAKIVCDMDLIDEKFPHYNEEGRALIRRAMAIASDALKDDLRDNGHPFVEHPMNVALIVSDEIGLPAECAAAVFLHETLRKHPDYDITTANFPQEIYKMVDGLDKIATIKPKDTRLEAENYKKLIVQYSTDPRVTVLKIADRLEVMRNLEMFPKLSKERKILETLMLYIPLAHQLGLYNIKSELEDIYFRFSDPVDYRLITNKLKATEKDRIKLTEEFIRPLEKKLSDAGIKYKLKIRTKTAYSIYKKMQKQKVPFEGVFDVFAIRFIIDCDTDHKTEEDLCWKVYSYVTEEYESDTKRLRDWISNPKPNGYESLHITVKNKDNAFIEVQIRTRRMDDIAENGHAAHWSYKGIKHEVTIDKWLTSVRYNLEHPQETAPAASSIQGNFRVHAVRRVENPAYRVIRPGFRIQYPLQSRHPLHGWQSQRQGCFHKREAQDRRHRGNHERKEPEAVSGLGELRRFRESQEQDPPDIERS